MENSIVLIVVKRYEDLEYHCNCEDAIKEIEVRKEIDVAKRGTCRLIEKFRLVTETTLKNIC